MMFMFDVGAMPKVTHDCLLHKFANVGISPQTFHKSYTLIESPLYFNFPI